MNNTFHFYKGLGYGFLLWLIMFAAISTLIGFGLGITSSWFSLIAIVLSAILAYTFAIFVKPTNLSQAFGYGALWVVIGLVLDYAISARFTENIFSSWAYWVGYAAILFAPTIEEQITETALNSV